MLSGRLNVIYILYGRVNPQFFYIVMQLVRLNHLYALTPPPGLNCFRAARLCGTLLGPVLLRAPLPVDVSLEAQSKTKVAVGWLTVRQDGGGSSCPSKASVMNAGGGDS